MHMDKSLSKFEYQNQNKNKELLNISLYHSGIRTK